MRQRRFKRSVLSQMITFSGEITIKDIRKKFNIPDGADVFVRVPGGADWSNCNLDIEAAPIQIRWQEVK